MRQLEDEGAPAEEFDQLDGMYKRLKEQHQELAKKHLYQWDTPIKAIVQENAAAHEKQFAVLCQKLGAMDSEVKELLDSGCTAGELLVQVTESRDIPLREKGNLLAHLKAQAGLL